MKLVQNKFRVHYTCGQLRYDSFPMITPQPEFCITMHSYPSISFKSRIMKSMQTFTTVIRYAGKLLPDKKFTNIFFIQFQK